MPLQSLKYKPGINREITSFSNEGGWFDGDWIRFEFGFPENIGGFEKYSSNTYNGSARHMHHWTALDGSDYLGIGTHLKYYIEEGGAFNDITPIRSTTSAGDVTFSATNGSSLVEVSDTSNGVVEGDFVTFSGAVSLGGNITAGILNAEHQVLTVTDADTYTIDVGTAANASDTGNGGSSVVGTYQINVGLDTTVGGTGWGAGTWARGTWGSASAATTTTEIRLWSSDNFGEDLIINARDDGIYYWDKTNTLSVRAVNLSALAGASNTPTISKQILVSDNDRHVIAFGCNPLGSSDQDPLLIRFSDQENPADWTPSTTNTAGDLIIGSGSTFMQAVETKREILVWTDTALHSMQFIGPPFTFGIQQIASSLTIMGPNAAVAVEEAAYWMGIDSFYVYNGRAQQLPCTVKNYVFNDLNFSQRDKITTGVNSEYTEVWWFYPSANSSENDKYVIYNYGQDIWYYGNLSRTAWVDRSIRQYPIAASGGYLYYHEIGNDADGEAKTSYIESSQVDIADGNNFFFIRKMIPDITFAGSESDVPSVTLTVKGRTEPGVNYNTDAGGAVARSSSSPVELYTDTVYLRLRGRSFALRVESNTAGTQWRLGTPRVDIRQDGRR